jgi:hypothetical protein
MIAYLNLRYMDDLRAQLFRAGLASLGFEVVHGLCNTPKRGDLFVTWNRIGSADYCAQVFQATGCAVIVTENASWGNQFAGASWYHMALNYHNTAGSFPIGAHSRWDELGIFLQPFRTFGETVVLPQRGIGSPPTAMPRGWVNGQQGRIRVHPGQREDLKPIEQDLAHAGKVVTWGSGAAIKALIMGIPVHSDMPNWIGQQNNTDAGRLAMFRRLAWAQFKHEEIANGFAFRHLLTNHPTANG